jgi:AMP-binding enzyme C-terminal domain
MLPPVLGCMHPPRRKTSRTIRRPTTPGTAAGSTFADIRGDDISWYEVEQAILGLEGVLYGAVIGVPSEFEGGEDGVLAVVVADGQIDGASLWTWCDGKVLDYGVPRYVNFVDSLPKTRTADQCVLRLLSLLASRQRRRDRLRQRDGSNGYRPHRHQEHLRQTGGQQPASSGPTRR